MFKTILIWICSRILRYLNFHSHLYVSSVGKNHSLLVSKLGHITLPALSKGVEVVKHSWEFLILWLSWRLCVKSLKNRDKGTCVLLSHLTKVNLYTKGIKWCVEIISFIQGNLVSQPLSFKKNCIQKTLRMYNLIMNISI